MEISEARKLKQLEDENRKLKQLVADLTLDKQALQWVIEKNELSTMSGNRPSYSFLTPHISDKHCAFKGRGE